MISISHGRENERLSEWLRQSDRLKSEGYYSGRLQRRAKAETIGTDTIFYANSLHNLALIYLKSEAYDNAEILYKQAIDIWSTMLGPNHHNVSTGYGHLSQLYSEKGAFESAYHYVTRSLEIDNNLTDQVAGFTSERQKLQFVASNLLKDPEPLMKNSLFAYDKRNLFRTHRQGNRYRKSAFAFRNFAGRS